MKLERVLRSRRRVGRCMPLINVIPPGLDFSALKVGALFDWSLPLYLHLFSLVLRL